MTSNEFYVDRLTRTFDLVKMTLADFTDADMLVRPVAGANHAAWQIGHLAASEARMVGASIGQPPALPAGFAEKFTGQTVSIDDPVAFPTKSELMSTFESIRKATIAWAGSLTPDKLDQLAPEKIRALAETIGGVPGLIAEHTSMHIGQFQVIRRRLGKPVLF